VSAAWSVPELVVGDGAGQNSRVVAKAQELLIVEGVLEGRAGSGTYVRAPRRRHRMIRSHRDGLLPADRFQAEILRLGMTGT
jgi:GntR family transcriptional regulator